MRKLVIHSFASEILVECYSVSLHCICSLYSFKLLIYLVWQVVILNLVMMCFLGMLEIRGLLHHRL